MSLSFYLSFHINIDECSFLDLELTFDRIDKERQLALSGGVDVSGTLHLPLRKFDADFGKDRSGLFQIDVARFVHCLASPPFNL